MLLDAQQLALALEKMDQTNAPAVVLAALSPQSCRRLTDAARVLSYRPGKERIGEGDKAVYQDFRLTADWPVGSPFLALGAQLAQLFQQADRLTGGAVLPEGFTLNDHMALFYPTGSKGITPHRDLSRFAGVISLITLSGKAEFVTSDDRQAKTNRQTFALRAGRLLLLRGAAFGCAARTADTPAPAQPDRRPFHAVQKVTEDRYCLGFRYDREL